jgi:hypothetical protein
VKFTVNHAVMLACSSAAALAEVLVNFSAAGNPLPFHLTAGAALAAATILGSVSKSVFADQGKPAPTVAADVLRAVAQSVDAGTVTQMHVAVLDAVKQNILPPGK